MTLSKAIHKVLLIPATGDSPLLFVGQSSESTSPGCSLREIKERCRMVSESMFRNPSYLDVGEVGT